ncbi:bifunctional hydroxymethylpyrimidine kinase/phosphomethylpyrimidine kinase [bacterium]|nr:bifunctional hydroxymethylpyrimidine kinase/phosphomethylpyrimidine kinase [bacterium]
MKKERLKQILDSFKGKEIIVLGDLILDEYNIGRVNRISPEAPVPIVEIEHRFFTPGGAANTAANITALGGHCRLVGVIGDDEYGRFLLEELVKRKIHIEGIIVDQSRPTTCKNRIIAHTQQVVRIDRERRSPISGEVLEKVKGVISEMITDNSVIVASDYNKGFFHPDVAGLLVEKSKERSSLLIVDPKPQNIMLFKQCYLLCPNEKEARYAVGDATESLPLDEVGTHLLVKLDAEGVLITQGEKGMTLYRRGEKIHIPALATEVHDVTGAGDTVIASLALSLKVGASLKEAMETASIAAAVVVRKLGTAQPSPQEMLQIVEELPQET